jgi:hypothetical protein
MIPIYNLLCLSDDYKNYIPALDLSKLGVNDLKKKLKPKKGTNQDPVDPNWRLAHLVIVNRYLNKKLMQVSLFVSCPMKNIL